MTMNDIGTILGITLMYASPLMFGSLSGVMSETTGVVNIGIEGMMTIGAFAGAAVAYFSGSAWLGFLCAGLAGLFIALFHAIATIRFRADHVVSGIAINFIGPGFALFLTKLLFDGAANTLPLDNTAKMPRWFSDVFPAGSFIDQIVDQYAPVYIAFLMAILIWVLLYKTRLGLRLRSVGEHPKAADTLGVPVYLMKYVGVLSSGFLAGLGGAALSMAIISSFRPTLVSGQGFIALAAMIFGRWTPHGAILGCLLFGLAQGLVVFLGGGRLPISEQLLSTLPYVITLVVLLFSKSSAGPNANGLNYVKE